MYTNEHTGKQVITITFIMIMRNTPDYEANTFIIVFIET